MTEDIVKERRNRFIHQVSGSNGHIGQFRGLLGILSLADLVRAQHSSRRQISKAQINDLLVAICEPDRHGVKEEQK
jgi:hypothetical protein